MVRMGRFFTVRILDLARRRFFARESESAMISPLERTYTIVETVVRLNAKCLECFVDRASSQKIKERDQKRQL